MTDAHASIQPSSIKISPLSSIQTGCRDVTPAEAAHYRSHGWAKLDGFADPALVAHLLKIAQERMGTDGDSNAPLQGNGQNYFNAEFCGGYAVPELRPVVLSCGRNARTLIARGDDTPVRYFADIFAAKLPVSKSSRHAGNKNTDFHQDFPSWALDRSGGMTFWIALTDLAPAAGTMEFLTGSHQLGSLGAFETHHGRNLTDIHPKLSQCPSSGRFTYAAGDATVHSNMTVHGAGPNHTGNPRWAYLVLCNPADACWTGAPSGNLNTDGLTQWSPLIESRFPVISLQS